MILDRFKLTDQVAIITGGGKGIGREEFLDPLFGDGHPFEFDEEQFVVDAAALLLHPLVEGAVFRRVGVGGEQQSGEGARPGDFLGQGLQAVDQGGKIRRLERGDASAILAGEFLGFSELLLDCRGVAAGGLHLPNNLGTNVGPRIFVTGFSQHGISVEVGHEVMIHETWINPEMMSGRQHGGLDPKHYFNGTSGSNDTSGIRLWGAGSGQWCQTTE